MDSPEIRIGDADREQALHALGEHMSHGRLTIDEYGERSAKVTAAKTRGDLGALFTDLPEPHPRFGTGTPTAEQAAPAPATSTQPATWTDRPLNQRAVAAGVPLFWVVAVIIGVTTHFWWIMALPFILTAVGRGLWGHEWEHDRRADRERERDHRRGDREREREHRRDLRDRHRGRP
ncbi:DUF1707 SHOCT-like domain-containing protein [Amycolatopsis pigmentata]|uniref:DUF1707 domain-containing protein n=1 Tax=Amycolatopsis pigmentata TaxID=450801 RepID=A0ABW5G4E2_9PSEU